MILEPNGNILETDDGGIYRLSTPILNTRRWASLNGNLRITEIHSVAYDPLNNVIFSGNQDNGVSMQQGQPAQPMDQNGDGIPDDSATRFPWRSNTEEGDG